MMLLSGVLSAAVILTIGSACKLDPLVERYIVFEDVVARRDGEVNALGVLIAPACLEAQVVIERVDPIDRAAASFAAAADPLLLPREQGGLACRIVGRQRAPAVAPPALRELSGNPDPVCVGAGDARDSWSGRLVVRDPRMFHQAIPPRVQHVHPLAVEATRGDPHETGETEASGGDHTAKHASPTPRLVPLLQRGLAWIGAAEKVVLPDPGTWRPRDTPFANKFIFARLQANGALDTGFAVGGIAKVDYPNTFSAGASGSMAVQRDGKIVAVASAMLRLEANGSLDTDFGMGASRTQRR